MAVVVCRIRVTFIAYDLISCQYVGCRSRSKRQLQILFTVTNLHKLIKFTSVDKTKLSVAQLVGYQTTKSVEKCKVRIFITLPIEIFPSHVFVTNACHPSLKIWLLNDRFMGLFDASSFAPFSGLSQLHLSASTLCKLEEPEPKGC